MIFRWLSRKVKGSILLLLLPGMASAQFFLTGQDPAIIHWREVKTDAGPIIYPESLGAAIPRLGQTLDILSAYGNISLKATVPKLPVIIHGNSSVSNGVTTWAPRRIEMYPFTGQHIYPQDWLEQLAIHEYRHAVQTAKMNQGFTRVLGYIFGEQAPGAILGTFVPAWFLEGDAIATETALGNAGRGRQPSFEMILRAQLTEKGIYSYEKATLGSYRTFIPDAYHLGYYLVAMGRTTYGLALWDHTLDRVARYPFTITPFAHGIKQETGRSKVDFYRSTLDTLRKNWRSKSYHQGWNPEKTEIEAAPGKYYANYSRPHMMNDGLILAEKTGIGLLPQLVILDNRKDRKCCHIANMIRGTLTSNGTRIAWLERATDPRWQHRNYAVIKTMYPSSGTIRSLSRKTRFASIALSHSGDRIAATENTEGYTSVLHILSSSTGGTLQSFHAPEGSFFLTSSWMAEDTALVCLMLTGEGKQIISITPQSGEIRHLFGPTFRDISDPLIHGRYLLFIADFTGVDNLFATDLYNQDQWQITNEKYGMKDPCFDRQHQEMIYSTYTADGFRICKLPLDSSRRRSFHPSHMVDFEPAEMLASQENVNIQDTLRLFDTRVVTDPASRKYRRGLHLFRVHSWGPLVVNSAGETIRPGFSVNTQNHLGTAVGTAGYEYLPNQHTGRFFGEFSYLGWYPVISARAEAGIVKGSFLNVNGNRIKYRWQEKELRIRISLPLSFTYQSFRAGVQPSIATGLVNATRVEPDHAGKPEGNYHSMDYCFLIYNYRRSTSLDAGIRWGQSMELNFRNTPFGRNNMGEILAAEANLFFPGILKYHAIRVYGGYQEHLPGSNVFYRFGDFLNFPGGYENDSWQYLFSASFNYTMNVAYPDLRLGSILYMKKITMNLFLDYAHGRQAGLSASYRSLGLEATTEIHLLRFPVPLMIGVRTAYKPASDSFVAEFLWNLNFDLFR
ncbi:MAG: hypothetical protein FJY10_07070 [Bacteroidetes bacterium]|nr:hypothetical protein [Bacteroidota bacterium]